MLPDLPFAKCFVCKKNGHLSSQCPQSGDLLDGDLDSALDQISPSMIHQETLQLPKTIIKQAPVMESPPVEVGSFGHQQFAQCADTDDLLLSHRQQDIKKSQPKLLKTKSKVVVFR